MTLAPLKDVLPQYGIDFSALARRAGIDPELLTRPGQRLPSARIQKLRRIAAQESNDPLFGLRAGQLARPGIFHALGLGIVSSTSVLAALRRIVRYSSVVSTNGRFVLIVEGPQANLETRRTEQTIVPCERYFGAVVVTICRILRLCAGPSAIPTLVTLPYQSVVPPEAYHEALGCPVEFSADRFTIKFDAELAARPVRTGNPELADEADRMAARYIEGLAPDTAATRVRASLRKASTRSPTSPSCLALPTRATSRAFRRWTGRTPRQFLTGQGDLLRVSA
ncbi:MAG: AraC family transcriptional regulator [Proteobacteria bacterium]|nr:AraC family transcriptional regulator [Pseudomonadota bacterium]